MAIEEEFSIEIPDKDADEIRTVGDAVKYISEAPEYDSPQGIFLLIIAPVRNTVMSKYLNSHS
jgi:hypothetical protein